MLPSEYVQMGWWQGAMAIDEDGNALEYGENKTAVAWCLGGAVEAAYFTSPTFDLRSFYDTVENVLREGGGLPLEPDRPDGHTRPASRWNDMAERTQEEVVAVLEAAERRVGLRR